MELERNLPEKFIFTQGWFDFWFVAIFFIALMTISIPSCALMNIGIFLYVILQILLPVFIFFYYYAIRYFEITNDTIIIKYGNKNKEIRLTKDQISSIEIKFQSGFFLGGRSKDAKIIYNFIYKPTVQLNLKGIENWLYGKKISVNNTLFYDKWDRALDVIYYLEKYFSDILKLDPTAKTHLIEKEKRQKEDIENS